MTKVAVVLTVKNEERLLRNNLVYHHTIGVTKAFVYFDNTTDNGKQSIADLDFVISQDSIPMEVYEDKKELYKFTSQGHEHHTARQCLNTYHAIQECERLGIHWLVSLDADELVCTSFDEISDMPKFFSEIHPNVNVVNLQTREALQRKASYHNIFSEELLFKTTYKYYRRLERIFKTFYNPFTKEYLKFNYWFGQHLGKGAVRIGAGVIPHNVHRYKMQDGTKLHLENLGYVLHYHAYDAKDFIKKFTNFSNHPDTFLSGNRVESIKLLLRDVVNKASYSEEELIQYFKDNLMFNDKEVKKLQRNTYLGFLSRKEHPLQEIKSVAEVFKRINKN